MILGIDSTGDMLLVGLWIDGKIKQATAPGKPHSRSLLSLVRKLLKKNRPQAIAVATGPGSYTGTRVGVVTANTLGWAWGVPVYGIAKSEAATMETLLENGAQKLARRDQSRQAHPLYPTIVG